MSKKITSFPGLSHPHAWVTGIVLIDSLVKQVQTNTRGTNLMLQITTCISVVKQSPGGKATLLKGRQTRQSSSYDQTQKHILAKLI